MRSLRTSPITPGVRLSLSYLLVSTRSVPVLLPKARARGSSTLVLKTRNNGIWWASSKGMPRTRSRHRKKYALDEKDLRGWHYVTSGGLLLHLSPLWFRRGQCKAATRICVTATNAFNMALNAS